MAHEYHMLIDFKMKILEMEDEIKEIGWAKCTVAFQFNYDELKATIIRMSNIKCNNATPFEFKY